MYLPLIGLLLGTVLKILVPYARKGLEAVAESGNFGAWPVFDYRYLAMVLLPIMEFGMAFLITEGLWQSALDWPFIYATMLGYSSTDISKEIVLGVVAVARGMRR